MVSDADIISIVSKYWLLMREGRRSIDQAGIDAFRELLNLAAMNAGQKGDGTIR